MELRECVFQPFVGDAYGQDEQRLLVLGESHYEPKTPGIVPAELTRRVVGDALENRQQHRFLTSIATAVAGRPVAPQAFWPGVSFYNFVQEFAGNAARQRPRAEAWSLGVPAFRAVLAALRPHLVLVCGRMLWNQLRLQPELSGHPIVAVGDERNRSRLFFTEGWSCVGGMLNHPASFGFRPLEWHPRVQAYRERAAAPVRPEEGV